MSQATPLTRSLALEGCAASAGHALACAFSSSDEYEAALIAERRAEGRYGRRWGWWHTIGAGSGIAAAIAALLLSLS
jgi:hypothetical protein